MTPLPTPGADIDSWGALLNAFLNVGHNSDGTLKGAAHLATVVSTAAQGIVTATWTSVQFDVNPAEENFGGMYDSAVSRFRFDVKKAGVYDILGTMKFLGNATGVRYCHLEVNDIAIARLQRAATAMPATDHFVLNVAARRRLAINDQIKLRVYQDSGITLNTVADTYTPRMSALWVHD